MRYSEQTKIQTIIRYQNGEPPKELIAELHIARSTFFRWVKQYPVAVEKGDRRITMREYDELLRRVEKQANMIAILKNAPCLVSAPLKTRMEYLESIYGSYEVRTLCEAMDVDRGSFYNHVKRNKRDRTWYAQRRERFKQLVSDVYYEFHEMLGTEKICAVLRKRGHRTTTQYVSELMIEMGLTCIRDVSKRDYDRMVRLEQKLDRLQQRFTADKPNQIWVSDVTYFKLKETPFFICIILDLYARKVVAYGISKRNSTQLLTSTFRKAWSARAPGKGLIFHSDRGAQYTSYSFRKLLHDSGVNQSFSRPGVPHDNSVAESFFATLKKEFLYRTEFKSEAAFRLKLADYIDLYNNKRPHKSNAFLTPAEKELTLEYPEAK